MFDENDFQEETPTNYVIVDDDFNEAGAGKVVDPEVMPPKKPAIQANANGPQFSPSGSQSNSNQTKNTQTVQDDPKSYTNGYGAAYSDDYEYGGDHENVIEPEVVSEEEYEENYSSNQNMQYIERPKMFSAKNMTIAALILAGGFMIYSSFKDDIDDSDYEYDVDEDEEDEEIEEDED